MDQLNQALFPLINGPADPAPAILLLAKFMADWMLYLAAAGLVIGWLRAGAGMRRALVQVAMATLLALAVNFTIAALWYHPRPFELGIGNQLIAHAPETSFPSDHATILFAVAFSLFAFGAARLWTWLALVAAVAVSWARVWLGIHWPLDMLGSIVVALGAVLIVALVRNTRGINRVTTFALNVFDRLLDLAHVPPAWVQRSGKA
ncbi:MAG TPA: undecaprenyl-diphosphatase [Rhodobacterales bacterium]|nr:undecaprenyl-diphosphatase [Rhodobacterales bacterium]